MNYDSLKAFLTVIEENSFTKASSLLGLTQSALSQKIARLESELEATLIIRGSEGLALSAAGEKLMVYARQVLKGQEEFLNHFLTNSHELTGHIRVAGYSSIMRSLVYPRIAPFLRKNPKVQIQFSTHELSSLEQVLKSNQADLVISDFPLKVAGVNSIEIGKEEYVLVRSSKYKQAPLTILDHNPNDLVSMEFFQFQGEEFRYERSFMGDIYGILDGVSLGLGQAVLSKHLIEPDKRFEIIKTKKRYFKSIYLHFYNQSYYPRVQTEVQNLLQDLTS